MSGVLVDYRCSDCGVLAEHRYPSPAPSAVACSFCGGEARRKYGFRVGASSAAAAAPSAGGHGHDHPDGLGTCGLLPTAARALTARLSGDERGLEREFTAQERMISEGTLDPTAGVHGLKKPETVAAAPAAAPAA